MEHPETYFYHFLPSLDSWPRIAVTILSAFIVFEVLQIIYNLTLQPLRSFPGPRLAAATRWYQAYHSLWNLNSTGGLYYHLRKLHDEYGPVVRISPNHLHFSSPQAYHDLYSNAATFPKDPSTAHSIGLSSALVCFTDSKRARERRELIAPHFSKRSIYKLQDLVAEKVATFTSNLLTASNNGKVAINLTNASHCVTLDIMTTYLFSRTLSPSCLDSGLESPEFPHPVALLLPESLWFILLKLHVPIFRPLLNTVLPWALERFGYGEHGIGKLVALVRREVDALFTNPGNQPRGREGRQKKTDVIFDTLFSPTANLSRDTIFMESTSLLFAGSDTPGTALSISLPRLFSRPYVLSKLRAELDAVWPSPDFPPPRYEVLEQLPYLSATVKEIFRFQPGTTTPLWRVAAKDGIVDGVVVPEGTTIGVAAAFVNFSEDVWGIDKGDFKPERWMGEEGKGQEKWLASFSRGARICIGINLAYMEITMVVARMVRMVDLRMVDGFEEERDLKWKDVFTAVLEKEVRVFVEERKA